MRGLERLWEQHNRRTILTLSALGIALIALADWWTMPYVSLGFLYLFPIILAAGFLPRWGIVILGIACAALAERFSSLPESTTRLALETLALAGCGLFTAELIRSRGISAAAQDRLRALVETSPAAIVTVDEKGLIELANRAAVELMGPRNGSLIGSPIAAFLPDLHHALRHDEGPHFRASMMCRGHKDNGEVFMAEVWFSTYNLGRAPKLAAIIGDVTGDAADLPASDGIGKIVLTSRELETLRRVVRGMSNKQIAAQLDISESAVKNAVQQLFMKSRVRARSQLVRIALERMRDLL